MIVEHVIDCNAIISYRSSVDQDSTEWILLDHAEKTNRTHNATIILYGRLNILQKTRLGSYKVTYDPSQYKVVDFFPFQKDKLVETEPTKSKEHDAKSKPKIEHINYNKLSWKILLDCTVVPSLTFFETSEEWNPSHESPENYPLAYSYRSITELEIVIYSPAVGDQKVEHWHEARVLKLLHGMPWDPRFRLSDFLDAERTAIHAERLNQLLALARIIKGACRVRTQVINNSELLLKISPKNGLSRDEWPTVLHPGTIINISSGKLFDDSVGSEQRSCPNGRWTARVDYDRGSAPICAILCQIVDRDELRRCHNVTEDDFAFSPTRLDITSQRGLIAVEALRTTALEYKANPNDVMAKLRPDTLNASVLGLPVKQMLLENEDQTPVNDTIQQTPRALLVSHSLSGVSEEKRSVIQNVFSHSVSMINGPPGSGKTLALVMAAEALLKYGNVKKILICSATKNVVDEITRTLRNRMTDIRVAKVVSHGVADKDYHARMSDNIHGTSLPEQYMEEASKSQYRFSTYTKGLKEIREKGQIEDLAVRKSFRCVRDSITREILKNTQIAVCTLASSALPVLADYEAEILLIDDAPRAKTYEVLMPIMRFGHSLSRLVLTGEPKGLGSYFTTSHGDRQWKKSLLEKLLAREQGGEKWPATQLKEVYRSHASLYNPIKFLYYNDDPLVRCVTSGSDDFMERFVRFLPLRVPGHSGYDMKFEKLTHFIHVPHPETGQDHFGSSYSLPECNVIMKVVKVLIESGACVLSDILIETFYTRQVEKLRTCAIQHKLISNKEDRSLAISTVHSAQGLEANVVILCLTKGSLANSIMARKQVTNVAFSRAKNILIIVGDWDAPARSSSHLYDCYGDDDGYHEEDEAQSGNYLDCALGHLEHHDESFLIRG